MVAGLQPGYQFTDLLVQLGGVTFGEVDTAGTHWHCATIDGWDSPDVRTTITQREADHGAWQGPVYLNERVITLAGKLVAPDRATLDASIDQLLVAAGLTDTVLTVHETIPKQAVVRRSGKVLAQRLTPTVLDYSVQVTAGDPRRYATTDTTVVLRLPSITGGLAFPVMFPASFPATVVAGDQVITNQGTMQARPHMVINGPVSQPLIAVTGPDGTAGSLLYSGDIAAGDWLDLDCDGHTAYYNSVASRRALISGAWPVLDPGQSQISFRAGAYSATATLTVIYRSAWM